MGAYDVATQTLIDELGRLPGVGPKSAQRIAFHLLRLPEQDALRLSRAIQDAKARVRWCERCFNLAEAQLCRICVDPGRDQLTICVVEQAQDIVAIERTAGYKGVYHVLQGAIAPINGVGPEQLRVRELLGRLSEVPVSEIILSTNPTVEGEATALYLTKLLAPIGMIVSRLASGLPVGGDLEYADEVTLGRALEQRRRVDSGGTPEPARSSQPARTSHPDDAAL
ncbi:MAG: recombination protein RecR [Actinobacteria bacterium]|nr:recombination protein RecR [Actinomycetota bacterium]MCB9390366.1 recombination protein RecR [Acidimicrobiia bacterium]